MNRKHVCWLVVLGLCFTLMVTSLRAADGRAQLRGVIEDQSKALVKGARITLTGTTSSFTLTTESNTEGQYTLINIPPGNYRLVVEQKGFSTEQVADLSLDLNEVRVLNVSLHISVAENVIEVTGQTMNIVPQQTFLRGLIDPRHMQELPLNGRNFADLIYTQPGVARDTTVIFGSGHAVNGARSSANNFLLDGGDDNDAHFPARPGLNISTSGIPVDSLEEFSVINSNATADYGRSAGGTVNLVTRPGSAKMHGALWEFLRNSVLDSRSFFDLPGHKNPFKQNQFGGRLGGEFKKTDYAFSYEGFRQRQLVPLQASVPTPDFLATVTNPTWKAILQSGYPAPNQPFAPGAVQGLFNTAFNNGQNQDSGFLRLDRSIGQAHTGSLTLAVANGNGSAAGGSGIQGNGSRQVQRNWHGVLSDSWTIRRTFYNTFRFSVNRISLAQVTENVPAAALQSGVTRTAGPFAGMPFDTTIGSPNGFPSVFPVAGTFSPLGGQFFLPQARAENTFHLQDSIAWMKGKHQVSAGVELRRIQINQNNAENARPTMFIDDTDPASLQAGMVLNQQQNFYVYNHTAMRGFRNWELDFFVADSYHVGTRLTLDYGLRYEANPPTSAVNNILSNAFVMQNGRPQPCQSLPYGAGMQNVALIIPSQFGISSYCTEKGNFAPRAGFAWDTFGDGRTVMRGGFGMYYDRIYGEAQHQFSLNSPFAVTTSIGGFAFDGTQASSALTPSSIITASTVDPDLHTPDVLRWHLTVSRELTKNTLLNTSYVGSSGHDLTRNERPNFGDVFPDGFRPSNANNPLMLRNASDLAANVIAGPFGAITNLKTDGISNYQALQVELLKRYSSGLTLQASYTWSHSLDTASSNLDNSTTLNNMLAPLFAPGSSCAGAAGNSLSTASLTAAVQCASGNSALTTAQASALFLSQYTSPASPRADYGDSAFDARQRFTANAVYELPLGRNKRFLHNASGFAGALVSGWQMATMIESQSGLPWPVLAGTDANFDGDNNDLAVATGSLSGMRFHNGEVAVQPNGAPRQYQCVLFDPVAGACGSPVAQGLGIIDPRLRLARGALRAPGLMNLDASVSKRFHLGEACTLQFRSEFFNLLNHVNFDAAAQAINDPAFGTISNQLLLNNTQSRQIQFALKLEF